MLLNLKLTLISNKEQGISNIKRNSESSTEQALNLKLSLISNNEQGISNIKRNPEQNMLLNLKLTLISNIKRNPEQTLKSQTNINIK